MQASVEINRPPEIVWARVTEPERLKRWISWMVEVRQLDPGPLAPGHRLVWVMADQMNGGQRMELENTITEVSPGHYLRVNVGAAAGFRGDALYRLVDLGGGRTRLEDNASFQFEQWFAKLMEPVIMPQARKKLVDDLEHLKQLAEAER